MADCKQCLHRPICNLWRSQECQDASCYSGLDGCDYFTGWISVEDRPPAFDTRVWAYLEKPNDRFNAPYDEQTLVLWLRNYKLADGRVVTRWERPFAGETVEYFPTHWMPLPEEPKEVKL